MDFRVLGPLDITLADGRHLCVRQPKQRALLSTFLVTDEGPLGPDFLIRALWGDDPPARASATLQTHLWSVRRLMTPASRIERHPAGYQLRVTAGEHVDKRQFQTLVDQGHRLLRAGDHLSAADLLGQALRLWREPPLPDLPRTPALLGPRHRLMEQHKAARTAWIDARLALGQHRELIAELCEITATDRLHENAWAQLMLALYRAGRQADALTAYVDARQAIATDCGIEPSVLLRDLHARILSGDRGLYLP